MKYALIALTIVWAYSYSLPEDCYSDNGKRFDNCKVVNGKTVFTKE